MQLGALGLPEGLALGGVAGAGALLVVVVLLRPSLPLEVLEEAHHHVRQAHLAVHRLLHHHGVLFCVVVWFLLFRGCPTGTGSLLCFLCATVLSGLVDPGSGEGGARQI